MRKIRAYVSPVLLIALLSVCTFLVYRPKERVEESGALLLRDLPMTLGKWNAKDVQLSDNVLSTLGAKDYVLREYTCGDKTLTLYITYFNTGSGALTHNPEKCYTGSGWTFLDRRTARVPEANQTVLESTVARGDKRQMVVYWYQDRSRVLISKGRHIWSVVSKALMGKPMHSLVASVSMPIGDRGTDGIEEELTAFSALVMGALAERLPS